MLKLFCIIIFFAVNCWTYAYQILPDLSKLRVNYDIVSSGERIDYFEQMFCANMHSDDLDSRKLQPIKRYCFNSNIFLWILSGFIARTGNEKECLLTMV